MFHSEVLYIEVSQWLIKKFIVLKPNDVMKVIKNHDISFDVATVIVSFLYGKKEQLAALNIITKSSDNIKCPTFHLIDDWISVDPEVLSNEEICSGMINSIYYYTKACCAHILLRNVKNSIELLPIPSNNRRLLQDCVRNCLKNNCIYMSNDLVKLSLEILDLLIDRCRGEEMLSNGNTILHDIACNLNSTSEGYCKDKWLSFLSKLVNRFPVYILSTQDSEGHTPYDYLINRFYDYQEAKLNMEVLVIFKSR